MKCIKTTEAVGHVLCHDITQIIPGEYKGPVFKKGHVVREEDIPVLLSVGKENLYIFEMDESMMHENDAAEVLCSISRGAHMEASPVNEGKIELTAETDGLLKINRKALRKLNTMGEIVIASRFGDFPVKGRRQDCRDARCAACDRAGEDGGGEAGGRRGADLLAASVCKEESWHSCHRK